MADIRSSFSKGLTAINVKTSSFLEEKKIQTYIATLNTEVEALLKEIGATVYESWSQNGSFPIEQIEEKLNLLNQKKQTILEQTKAMEELTRKEQEILGTGDVSKTDKVFCPNCGQSYDTTVKFCKKCGTKIQ